MTRQERADLDEAVALARYFTVRQAFSPCWGTRLTLTAQHRPQRPARRPRRVRPERPAA